ncbi:zinc-finger homeodomain protein 11-like [Olea europaea var. sylvestris]|uniref:zinc-finger homeodomain protein 11-like n=1 Tax=Olea europaea var. sylvestris TaxID=158386 RepID=UPI000C1D5D61|nr:zinc-finger homeodomain protein 11-like [Olea europaea var. sylvestris]
MEEDNLNDNYRECLRNHAATLGSYATDGCGEFTLDDTFPGGLCCAACGCHRNFHRKITYRASYSSGGMAHGTGAEMIEYGGGSGVQSPESERSSKKRFRTKFTEEQKEKMLEFAEKLGWKLLRKDEEDETERFCRGIGISRKVFKVWMHNHKNSSTASASTGNASSLTQ